VMYLVYYITVSLLRMDIINFCPVVATVPCHLPTASMLSLATTLLALVILQRYFFSQSTSAYSPLGAMAIMCYTNLHFTYLLTYSEHLIFTAV